jgi:hypothetical protein
VVSKIQTVDQRTAESVVCLLELKQRLLLVWRSCNAAGGLLLLVRRLLLLVWHLHIVLSHFDAACEASALEIGRWLTPGQWH